MSCQLDHVRLMIIDDDTAMPENCSGLGERVIANRNIQLRFGKQAAQRPPNLYGFESRARCHAATESLQDVLEREAKRNFNQPGLLHPTTELHGHRPARPFCPEGGMPRAPVG